MTGVDATLLERVLRYVTDHPEQHDQESWAYRDPDCGTVCCVAGWTVVLAGVALNWDGYDTYRTVDGEAIPEVAARLLGLNSDDVWSLFAVNLTLDDLWKSAEELTGGVVRRDREGIPA